jgi:hypothetical protein
VMPDDQEIRVAEGLGSVHQLRDPVQPLGHPSSGLDVGEESPKYRQQRIVAAQRVRQPQCREKAVPDLLCRPASEGNLRGAQQGA